MPPQDRTGVFLSYARHDGERLARDLRARLEAEGIRLWRDREEMEGGRDWWLQITAALDAVEFMVLLMTPAAAGSPLVRQEWRYARQRGVCVYPITGSPDLDFGALPRWMRSVHFYDLAHEWPKLVHDLRTRCSRRRVPFMAEDLPPEFVPRHAEFDRLLSQVLDRERAEPIAVTTALRAAGGYGKTVLARALCHHEDVQNAFDDGILWVTLGERPGDLTPRVEDLIHMLGGERPGFASLEAATATLVELLADRDVLMVIDDVWDAAHAKPFLQGGPRCARVITTRILDTVPARATRIDVDAMQQDEAAALAGYGLPPGFETELRRLAARLGEWPLLLTLVNGALRDRVHASGQSMPAALGYVSTALDRRGLTFFDARDPTARHQAVASTLALSIERLDEIEKQRFTELAVFPEDVRIPLATIERLWARTGGLDDFDTEHLCERLHRLSLTLAFDPTQRYVTLHDVIRQYLVHQLGARCIFLHQELVAAHRPPSGAWAGLPLADPYMWDHLAAHLHDAGSDAELVDTVTDLRYLAAKTFLRKALAAERDLLAAEAAAPADEPLRLLRRRFVQSGHVLNTCARLADLEATLHSRLQHVGALGTFTRALARSLAGPRLAATHPLPDLGHPAVIRTATGRSGAWGCAIAPDGTFIASAGSDGAVMILDASTAAERHRLPGHRAWVRRCGVSADGTRIVSASYDRRLRIWEARTGALCHVLTAHTDGVTDCAFSPDGTLVVSASLDETVRIWDARSGVLLRTLAAEWQDERGGWLVRRVPIGHTAAVWGCAISPDGRTIASASSDQTVRLWDLASGAERHALAGHTSTVLGCAFSPDGTLVASAGADGSLRLWTSEPPAAVAVIEAHAQPVHQCAFTPDGRWIVSASADGTLKIFEVPGGREVATCTGHTDAVNDCAVSPDGTFFVSASADHTLKIWETTAARAAKPAAPETGWVNGCAVGPGARIASASSDAMVRVWDAGTGLLRRQLAGHTGPVRSCAFDLAGERLVTGSADKSLRVWEVESGACVATLLGHRDWVNACSVAPGGHVVLSGSSDRTLRLWDARTWTQRLRVVAHGDSIAACRFSPDGRFFVSASADTTLKVWALDRARDVWESLPLDHQRLTEADWDRLLEPRVLRAHRQSVADCAIARDGSCIVSASSDCTLVIWDVATGEPRRVLSGHRQDVTGCAISPDGAYVASVSEDATVRVWRLDDGVCLTTLHVDGVLEACEWLDDGERLVAVGAAGVYLLALLPAAVPVLGEPRSAAASPGRTGSAAPSPT